MTNLWDLVEQIRDPDGWREKKIASLREQWGYSSSPLQEQGNGVNKPIYTDSLPVPNKAPRDLSLLYKTWEEDLKNKKQRELLMQGSPEWFPERYDLNDGINMIKRDRENKYKRML